MGPPAADAIRADLRRLADPRGLGPAEADRLPRELPVVVLLIHAVHGNEVSSCDAALFEAYHQLAAQDDPAAEAVRKDAIAALLGEGASGSLLRRQRRRGTATRTVGFRVSGASSEPSGLTRPTYELPMTQSAWPAMAPVVGSSKAG